MSLRRVGWLAATAMAVLLWMSCGQVYRPVVIPVSTTPPNPANFHAVFGISSNIAANPGAALQIDVSGDSNIGVASMGINPTHAAIFPNNSRVFVASAGSSITGGPDVVTSFAPAPQSSLGTGLGTPTTFTLPNVGPEQSSSITSITESGNVVTANLGSSLNSATVGGQILISGVGVAGYNGNFVISAINGAQIQYVDAVTGLTASSGGTATIPLPTFCSYLPDFVATTQNSAAYVANYGVENGPNCSFSSTDSVMALNASTTTISKTAYLPAGSHPVAMAETPNAQSLYVANQGNGTSSSTVLNLSTTDLSTLATIPVGVNPTWVVSRLDGRRVYVLTQGDGKLVPIDTPSNTVLLSQTNLSVGAGANFLLYDPHLNRLYVTNPSTGTVYVFSATGGVDLGGTANDTPVLLKTISMTAGTNPPCTAACSPVSIAALADGSRFYVASYQLENACSDPNVGTSAACMIPMLTVFDAPSMTVKTATSTLLTGPSLSLLTSPPFALTQYAVAPVSSCAAPPIYTPGSTRFRMFTTAAADSSHVYVAICDAGTIAAIRTNTNTISTGNNAPDSLVADIVAPFGACNSARCSTVAALTSFSITGNIVTFQAVNNFTPGIRVVVSGLSSTEGVSLLNGKTLTVLATGLSASQFEANLSAADLAATSDTGTAVPLTAPQAPIYLLTGQ